MVYHRLVYLSYTSRSLKCNCILPSGFPVEGLSPSGFPVPLGFPDSGLSLPGLSSGLPELGLSEQYRVIILAYSLYGKVLSI